jgi:hypothetical protein
MSLIVNDFRIEVDQADLSHVQEALGNLKSKSPVVISRGLNKTATTARQKLATQVKAVYTYKKSVRSQMTIKRATYGNLEAVIESRGHTHRSTSFKYSFSKSAGANIQPLRGGGAPLHPPKAWKRGDFIRQRKLDDSGKPVWRYDTHTLRGPSTPKMVENEKVYGRLKGEIESILHRNIESAIQSVLAGR